MKDFLPAAQAVMDAAVEVNDLVCCDSIAAALRAAAPLMALVQDHQQLIAIAAELEAMPID
jgi:hypothetical protein